MNFNRLLLAGNLTKDPESREVVVGGLNKTVTSFTIAVNDRRGDKEHVTFLQCEAWNKLAELIRDHFSKGKAIFVEGKLRQDRWETDGKKYTKHKMLVEQVCFIGSRNNVEGQSVTPSVSDPRDQDDIPF